MARDASAMDKWPALRSPAIRMQELHVSLKSTRRLLYQNWPKWDADIAPDAESTVPNWRAEWEGIEKEANALAVLVKKGGWGRYSAAHLWCCGKRMKRLDRKFASVTRRLVAFNKQTFTRLDAKLDPQNPDCTSTSNRGLLPKLPERPSPSLMEDPELGRKHAMHSPDSGSSN
ncbi:uncharacterized protein TRAVEDRAFT_24672 [Trametes versicolor FP-101664 SS1]|uniref:Uncharacterized protein n=1 Tax=Trametes versicolor (strain FP-101664) TaxID=717944 RepID=R7SAC5_TRAVS|nr:uncharacterized protein TRAVEDRAFT_24672 [Trametes versicolor FP-101664 SS1]EIW51919.1 hypothetical protein TRAVEDRAFT_24672 [Trametes versicolor FP-101664 SS1]